MRTLSGMESGDLEPDDRELVGRARQGDHAAFHELVDRYAASMLGLAAYLVGNVTDAEDIVQETFSGAFRGLKAFRGRSSVKTWLTRILIRQVAAHLRGRRRFPGLPRSKSSAGEPLCPSASQSVDARMDVTAAILALSPEHREVVVLRELQGLSYEEIAEVLAVPRGTVESRLFRARRAMQELLKDYLA
jgi:RNA polymerase sigma-70 factor (ECF subfamily)